MKVHERNYVWLGLTNKRKEGTFEWSSGRQTSFNVTKYWNSGQSNSSFDCAYIFQGKLGTYKCSTSGLHFMCQKRHWAGKEKKDEDYKITSRKEIMLLFPATNVDLLEIEKTAQQANTLYRVMIIFLLVITLILLSNTALVANALHNCQQVISSTFNLLP